MLAVAHMPGNALKRVMSEEEFIKTSDVEERYHVSRQTLRDLTKAGKLPVYRSRGNKNYYRISELETAIAELRKFRRVDMPEPPKS